MYVHENKCALTKVAFGIHNGSLFKQKQFLDGQFNTYQPPIDGLAGSEGNADIRPLVQLVKGVVTLAPCQGAEGDVRWLITKIQGNMPVLAKGLDPDHANPGRKKDRSGASGAKGLQGIELSEENRGYLVKREFGIDLDRGTGGTDPLTAR